MRGPLLHDPQTDASAELLDLLESFGEVERCTALAFVAGRGVELDREELNEALRRALVVRAVGGDPHRELSLDEDAVSRLADELDTPERRAQLQQGLARLPRGRAAVAATLDRLAADRELAWRAFCAALLADELGSES